MGCEGYLVCGEKIAILFAAVVSTTRPAGESILNFFRATKGVGWYVKIREAGAPSNAVKECSSTPMVMSLVRYTL